MVHTKSNNTLMNKNDTLNCLIKPIKPMGDMINLNNVHYEF